MNGYERTLAIYYIMYHAFSQSCVFPEVMVSAYGENGEPRLAEGL